MQIPQLYQLYLEFPQVCTDTRQIDHDCLFFALKGESFNGNSFANQALEQGARYVIIDDAEFYKDDERYILVDDVLKSLQELAKYHRSQLSIPFIGITGTNGKTTTKELVYSVLSQHFKTYATKGNLNNHIGVPLTILSLPKDLEIAIIEMGANHIGEIGFLCDIAQPTHGLISNVGRAHLEGFGSFEGVKKAKGELYDFLNEKHGLAFIQGDNKELRQMAELRNLQHIIWYGFSQSNSIQGELVKADPYLTINWRQADQHVIFEVTTQLTGSYNIENMLAAVAIGIHFELTAEEINSGLQDYTPKNNRSQILKTAFNTVIADYYNANASSMKAAIENIGVIQSEKKALILGDMFEMGEESESEHRKVIELAKSVGAERLIFVGSAFYALKDDSAEFYQNTTQLRDNLEINPLKGYLLLLKASRGMAFEKIIDLL